MVMMKLQVGVVDCKTMAGMVVLRWEGHGGDGWYLTGIDQSNVDPGQRGVGLGLGWIGFVLGPKWIKV